MSKFLETWIFKAFREIFKQQVGVAYWHKNLANTSKLKKSEA